MRFFRNRDAFFGDDRPAGQLAHRPHPNGELLDTFGKLRRRSPEADFGVHWHQAGSHVTYRLSLIQYTGELYLAKLAQGGRAGGPFDVCSAGWPDGAHQVIGELPVDAEDPDLAHGWYTTADKLLGDWPSDDVGGSLLWLRNRLSVNNLLVPELR